MFHFTIRELALVTLVVAMGVGWWRDRTRLENVVNEQSLFWHKERAEYLWEHWREIESLKVGPKDAD